MNPGTGNGKGTEGICKVCGEKFIRNSKDQQTCSRSWPFSRKEEK